MLDDDEILGVRLDDVDTLAELLLLSDELVDPE